MRPRPLTLSPLAGCQPVVPSDQERVCWPGPHLQEAAHPLSLEPCAELGQGAVAGAACTLLLLSSLPYAADLLAAWWHQRRKCANYKLYLHAHTTCTPTGVWPLGGRPRDACGGRRHARRRCQRRTAGAPGGLCAPMQPRAQHSGPLHASITHACIACMHAHMLRCKQTHPLQEFRSFARPGSKPKVLIMSYTTFRCAAAQDACCTCTAFCCMHARRAESLQEPCTAQHTNAYGHTT